MVEHQTSNLAVAGSSPVHRTIETVRPTRERYHEARGRRTYVRSAAVGDLLLRLSHNGSDYSSTDLRYVVRGYRVHTNDF